MSPHVYSSNNLTLEVQRDDEEVRVVWTGRSTAREPMTFIGPIITEALEACATADTKLVLDFRTLAYMNSSTITPLIRLLRQANRGSERVLVLYRSAARWQEMSFSALTVFATKDGRIEIRGAP
jgi:hypothetical protein